jgi:hypothetical protein
MLIIDMYAIRKSSLGGTEPVFFPTKCRNIIKDYDVKGMIGAPDARTGLYKSDGRDIPISLQVRAFCHACV